MITLFVFWIDRKHPQNKPKYLVDSEFDPEFSEGGIYWGTVTIDVIGLIVLGSWLGVC